MMVGKVCVLVCVSACVRVCVCVCHERETLAARVRWSRLRRRAPGRRRRRTLTKSRLLSNLKSVRCLRLLHLTHYTRGHQHPT